MRHVRHALLFLRVLAIYARSDCGPAVLGMALADYGVDEPTLELRQLTHTYQGTWPTVRVGTALFLYQDPAVRPIEDGRGRWISRDQLEWAMAPVWPARQAVALGG